MWEWWSIFRGKMVVINNFMNVKSIDDWVHIEFSVLFCMDIKYNKHDSFDFGFCREWKHVFCLFCEIVKVNEEKERKKTLYGNVIAYQLRTADSCNQMNRCICTFFLGVVQLRRINDFFGLFEWKIANFSYFYSWIVAIKWSWFGMTHSIWITLWTVEMFLSRNVYINLCSV